MGVKSKQTFRLRKHYGNFTAKMSKSQYLILIMHFNVRILITIGGLNGPN